MEPPPDPKPPRPASGGLRIVDLAGLVIGFGLAATLVREVRPAGSGASLVNLVLLGMVYLWLGLAMSGPFVLLLERRRPPGPSPLPTTDAVSRYSGDEITWIWIGGYFIALFLVVSTARGDADPWLILLLLQAIVAVAILGQRLSAPRAWEDRPGGQSRWTKRAAPLLLWTWPPAWILMVLLMR